MGSGTGPVGGKGAMRRAGTETGEVTGEGVFAGSGGREWGVERRHFTMAEITHTLSLTEEELALLADIIIDWEASGGRADVLAGLRAKVFSLPRADGYRVG